jgi:hypothetical protein
MAPRDVLSCHGGAFSHDGRGAPEHRCICGAKNEIAGDAFSITGEEGRPRTGSVK